MSSNFLEAFNTLTDLYSKDLTEAYDKASLETSYKGYKIYSYSVEHDYGHRDAAGIPEKYSKAYCFEHKDGRRQGGFVSLADCKKGIDELLSEEEYDSLLAKANKLLDTCAEAYRGFEIYYKHVVDAATKPCTYNYYVGTTRKSKWLGGEIENKTFSTIAEAKKAIDACISEWNAYADDSTEYKESLKCLIREALSVLDVD